ncbi:MAG: fibronectin type III domain-containing protein [bacterium]
MNMTQMLKTSQSLMKRSALAAALLLAGGAAQAGVIYSDTFARIGSLNGSTPDTTSGLYGGTSGATWQAVTAATTDGADALTNTSGDGGTAFLPFTPEAGYVYTLTMNFTFPASAGWVGYGYCNAKGTYPNWGAGFGFGSPWGGLSGNFTAVLDTTQTVGGKWPVTLYRPDGTPSALTGMTPGSVHYVGVQTFQNPTITPIHSMSLTIAVPPATPTGLGATPLNTSVLLNWTASDGATGYNVWSSNSVSGVVQIDTTTNAPAYTKTGLDNGTEYFFKVSATNSYGESAYSAAVSATPAAVKANQTITFALGTNVTKTMTNAPFADTATAISLLPVTYASTNEAVATVDASGTVTIVGLGTTAILADQAGNEAFNPAPQVSHRRHGDHRWIGYDRHSGRSDGRWQLQCCSASLADADGDQGDAGDHVGESLVHHGGHGPERHAVECDERRGAGNLCVYPDQRHGARLGQPYLERAVHARQPGHI